MAVRGLDEVSSMSCKWLDGGCDRFVCRRLAPAGHGGMI